MATPFRYRLLANKILVILAERQGKVGKCQIDIVSLIGVVADRYPRSQRPRLCQVEKSLVLLMRQKKIRAFINWQSERVYVLAGAPDCRGRRVDR